MLIDWFTVIAQMINFLVLVWLLNRYLYNPILKALNEREKKVASQLKDAEDARTEAQGEKEEFKRKNDEFNRKRKVLFLKVSEEAAEEQKRLFDEARKELESFRLKKLESLKHEYLGLNQEIALRTQQEVFAIARKTLSDLANMKLEECIAEVFIRQLCELNGEEKKLLTLAVKSSRIVRIQSVFSLLPEQQAEIERVVRERFAVEAKFKFETVSDLVGGVELIADGYKAAWSIADYVSSLEKSIGELLAEKTKNFNEKGK